MLEGLAALCEVPAAPDDDWDIAELAALVCADGGTEPIDLMLGRLGQAAAAAADDWELKELTGLAEATAVDTWELDDPAALGPVDGAAETTATALRGLGEATAEDTWELDNPAALGHADGAAVAALRGLGEAAAAVIAARVAAKLTICREVCLGKAGVLVSVFAA